MPAVSDSIPTLVNLVLDDYLSLNLEKLGKNTVGSLLTQKYKIADYRELKENQKYDFLNLLYAKSKELFGLKVANSDLERSVKNVVSKFGVTKGYFDLMDMLPQGVLENEKLSLLGREELEDKVKVRTKELEDAKDELEKRVAERTLELEAERNKFRVVLYNTFDGVFALDRQNRVIALNKAMEEMTGYLEAEILGNNVDEYVKLSDTEEKPVTASIYSPTLKIIEDKSVYRADHLILKGRGSKEFHVSLISSVIAEGNEANVGCIVTVHDITQQKELETMKLDFVSIAAHELRTPLTAVRGYLSLLMTELAAGKGTLSKDHMEYLERSFLSANQLFVLVENLLNVSRIERGNVKLSKEVVDWAPLVSDIVQSFMELANERKVKLSYVPVNSSSKVSVDRIMIGEVLSNLLDNAIRYTASGGQVLVFLEPNDRYIITHVKDTGQGIPKESIPHLFTKFYRVSGVLEQGSKGTGLGLYISKEIVKLHGGDIWAESDMGKGSVFSFSVPKA